MKIEFLARVEGRVSLAVLEGERRREKGKRKEERQVGVGGLRE